MGFLSGAFGKITAHREMLRIQHEKTQISAQLLRVTKQIKTRESQLRSQEQNINNLIDRAQYSLMMENQNKLREAGFTGDTGTGTTLGASGTDTNNVQTQNLLYSQYQSMNLQIQNQCNYMKTMYSESFDAYKEIQMQQLNDMEADLTAKKDALDSEYEIVKAEYEDKKKEEQEGAKELVGGSNG